MTSAVAEGRAAPPVFTLNAMTPNRNRGTNRDAEIYGGN
jgi:hypothetical protein